jgi:hypothetical protein
MPDVDARLDKIERKIDTIASTLQTVAVQSERITNIQAQISAQQTQIDTMWAKYDAIIGPDGILSHVRDHQASCPRQQIKWMWTVMVSLALCLLGAGWAFVK